MLKIEKSANFGKKGHGVHLWVKFSTQNVVSKVSRRKNSQNVSLRGLFFRVFFTKCLSKCPSSTNLPSPEEFLAVQLHLKMIDNNINIF